MLSKTSLLLALAAIGAQAHTGFTGLYVNGKHQGDAVGIRMSTNTATATYPLRHDSEDVVCNAGGTKGVARVIPVNDGDSLSFEFRSWMDDPSNTKGDGPIDRGHLGPCAIYLKKVDSAKTDTAVGNGWFKIWEDGYDESTSQWCVEKFIKAGGFLTTKLPQGLQGGDYLVRPEILALHQADKGDPQFYAGCAQINIASSGNLVPKSTVSIPGYIKSSDPGVTFNIWKYPKFDLPYPIPGPKVAELVQGTASSSKAAASKDVGLPEGCILQNANWCGFEVPDYSSERGCWDSSSDCWSQADKCWSSAPPTGASNCKIWAQKCENINTQCHAGNWNGPQNKGKVLTPSLRTISPQAWGNSVSGSSVGAASSQNDAPEPAAEVSSSSSSAAPVVQSASPTTLRRTRPTAGVRKGSYPYKHDADANAQEASSPAAAAASPEVSEAPNGGRVYVTVTKYLTHTVDSYTTVYR